MTMSGNDTSVMKDFGLLHVFSCWYEMSCCQNIITDEKQTKLRCTIQYLYFIVKHDRVEDNRMSDIVKNQ